MLLQLTIEAFSGEAHYAIAPWIIPAVIGAGGAALSWFGGKRDTETNIKGIREQNQANAILAAQQARWNEQQWHKQNAYNHPQQQMARLAQAGLNPRLIYGTQPSSAVGTAGDVRGYDRAEAKNVMEGFSRFSDVVRNVNTTLQSAATAAQTAVSEQQAIKLAYDTLKTAVDTKDVEFDLGLKKDLRQTSIQAAQVNVERQVEEARRAAIERQVAQGTKEPRIEMASVQIEKAKEEIRNIIAERRHINERVKGEKLENVYRRLKADLARNGLTVNDNKLIRLLFGDFGKDLMNQIKPLIK